MNTNATINEVVRALSEKGVARIAGFGKFELVLRKARTGRNFKTGEPVEVPAHYTVRFKANRAAVKGAAVSS